MWYGYDYEYGNEYGKWPLGDSLKELRTNQTLILSPQTL